MTEVRIPTDLERDTSYQNQRDKKCLFFTITLRIAPETWISILTMLVADSIGKTCCVRSAILSTCPIYWVHLRALAGRFVPARQVSGVSGLK